MKPFRAKGAGVVLFCVLAATAVGVGREIFSGREFVARALPGPPDPSLLPSGLSSALARAQEGALGYFGRGRGVAELSRLYHANGFFTEARACYAVLRQLEPKEARWAHLEAGVLAGFGDLAAAEPLERQAVALRPDYLPAALRLGEIELKSNRPAAAAATYAAVLGREPANRYALLGLAKCAVIQNGWEKARGHLQQALAVAPEFAAALALLITVEERAGNAEAARALAVKLGKREVADFTDAWSDEIDARCYDPYRLSVLAAAALTTGDSAKARGWLERAIELAPKEGAYRRQLGKLFFQAGDLPRAKAEVEEAVALSPADGDAWILLAEIFTAQRDIASANRALTAGVTANPQSPALRYAIGRRLTEARQFPAAIRELKAVQALRPNEVNAGIDLATIYFQQERIEEGLAELKAVLAIQPGHPLAMEILTRHAIQSNDEKEARRWWGELKLQPRVPAEDLSVIAEEFRQQFRRNPE